MCYKYKYSVYHVSFKCFNVVYSLSGCMYNLVPANCIKRSIKCVNIIFKKYFA